MNITQQDIKHIAELARLGIDENEIDFYTQELSQILQYVEVLQKVSLDDTDIDPYITPVRSQTQQDGAQNNFDVQGMPDDFIKVKKVIDKSNE